MTHDSDDAVVQRFRPTSGLITGVLGLLTAAAVLVAAAVGFNTGTPLGVAIVALLGAVVVWAAMLRPVLWVTGRDLVMRGMFHTDRIPLAAIEKVVVTQVLAVWAGGQRYVSPAVGYTVRQTVRAKMKGRGVTDQAERVTDTHQEYVQSRIDHLALEAAQRAGVRRRSPEQQALAADVRRTWAWPEIVAAAVLVLAFLVWLVL
jgi:hypothetical protein